MVCSLLSAFTLSFVLLYFCTAKNNLLACVKAKNTIQIPQNMGCTSCFMIWFYFILSNGEIRQLLTLKHKTKLHSVLRNIIIPTFLNIGHKLLCYCLMLKKPKITRTEKHMREGEKRKYVLIPSLSYQIMTVQRVSIYCGKTFTYIHLNSLLTSHHTLHIVLQ